MRGKCSFELKSRPRIVSSASFVGEKEGEGPLGSLFDVVCRDDTLGLKSWEKAESRMFESAVRTALFKIGKTSEDLSCLVGGDLLDQIISSGFAAREIHAPFLGLYSACSTVTEALIIAGMLTEGGFSKLAACAASSHFSSVERQLRFPLEMGVQPVPTAQRTVTGAGSIIVADRETAKTLEGVPFSHVALTGGTIGCVEDYGITDANNMGAAMAPAACKTIVSNLRDLKRSVADYDRIITGDLAKFGSEMLYELCLKEGVDIESKHEDCGKLIFGNDKTAICGGSGCGCAASVLSSYFLPLIESGELRRVLFLATGALLSPTSSMQGESIPCVSHAIVLEHAED